MAVPAYTNTGTEKSTPARLLLYYITDRRQFAGADAEQRRSMLRTVEEAARAGVDYIQIRERDLTGRALQSLVTDAVKAVRRTQSASRVLVNSRVDVALAAGADGVHLRGDDVFASEARAMAGGRPGFVIGVSCHTTPDVSVAWSHGADFAVFGPVFEKNGRTGTLVEGLVRTCAVAPGFVLALGGVTAENANACVKAGAIGIAAIRLFQQVADLGGLVRKLRR